MGVRTESAEAVDEVAADLMVAVVDWLDEGGDPELILAWLYHKLGAADDRLSRALRSRTGTLTNYQGVRLKDLVDADPGARDAA